MKTTKWEDLQHKGTEEMRAKVKTEALAELCAMENFDRITHTPGVMQGKACVRGMRVTVGMIVRQIAASRTVDELLFDYPYLEREDILQALQYAAWSMEQRETLLASA
jgi:uncharacterized protein (DUF433 family)